jgi:predicted HTH transcriptional regulator
LNNSIDFTKKDEILLEMHVEIIDTDDQQKYSGHVDKIISKSDDPDGIIVLISNGKQGHIINIVNSIDDAISRILAEGHNTDNKLNFLEDDMRKIAIPQIIQSFLNADGGWVYLGVHDNKPTFEEKLVGLESEKEELEKEHGEMTWRKFEDKYAGQIMGALKKRLSTEANLGKLVDPHLLEVNGKYIFEIFVKRSPVPVFYQFLSGKKSKSKYKIFKLDIDGKNTDRILDEFHYRVGSDKEDCPTGESLYIYLKKRFFNQ